MTPDHPHFLLPNSQNTGVRHLSIGTIETSEVIRFSSPMPWVLAIVLSVAIWAVMGWSIWWFVHRI
jgi:hypothetical protein